MAIYRTKTESDFKNYGIFRENHITIPTEWDINSGQARIDDPTWIERYKYEAKMINNICIENQYTKILELGSGPGVLGQHVLELNSNIQYSYVDKPAAKDVFTNRKYKGTFYVKDLMNSFDISNLDTDYDMVIANDFLEHIANPSDVLYKCRQITKENSSFFISVPNWRMGHDFIYRGLFDYDNFIYFFKIHGWEPESIAGSPLKCPPFPKQSSEDTMPNEILDSWNWYFNTIKINDQ
jgi:2-polyprenyl-3-methyl-5-hydroxy-6-metoxy-1,4-benzoquinol methylase